MDARLPLRGRTAVVTGAARGIGEGIARALVARGARVALLGLEGERLARVGHSLPGDSASWAVDVTDEAAMERTAALVRERFGPVSVVVANAGVAEAGPFLASDPATWRRVIDVNLTGSAVTARVFLPALLTSGGYYLQICSLAGIASAPLMTAYCASKSGAEGFAHCLRAEFGHRGVGVGVAYLSWTDTEMIRAAGHHDATRLLRSRLPWPASRTYPLEPVAARVVRGIERRASGIYAPPWLLALQAVRAGLPGVVAWRSHRAFRDLPATVRLAPSGLLGEGGTAALPPETGT
ncbi:SDR family oxidoreductase [Streptomyces sp. NPDC046215]|uniref:SDR family oxidoreductase n=1 Tax=Streptomyces stramineus TaxID=173861 RepID=A0ABN0ZWM5_9ACTN